MEMRKNQEEVPDMSAEAERGDGRKLSRRNFLGYTGAAAAFSIVPSSVLAGGETSPSDKLNIAGVGVGGRGRRDLAAVDSQNIVALCDVDEKYAAKTFKKYPKANTYTDYRRMLDEEGDTIDAVMVATPDHTHAVVSAAAMKRGKHVYCEKPLTHSIWEARRLGQIAEETGVVTQMGNQGHSNNPTRRCREWVEAGAIGRVREVHCWTNRPVWPQGKVKKPKKKAPDTLNWNLWLGPAKKRPYSPAYLPFKWRGWQDFGTGAFGDMGCHIMDMPFYTLKLREPDTVEASSTRVYDETYPERTQVRYTFPSRGDRPGITFTWYSGGMQGIILVGDKGALMAGNHASDPRIYPLSLMKKFKDAPKKYPRVRTSHHMSWVNACKKDDPTAPASSFDYAVPLTETVLLGTVAILAQKPLEWDGDRMKVTNVPDANRYVKDDYRRGWSL
jgi:predicted dehydrogenase